MAGSRKDGNYTKIDISGIIMPNNWDENVMITEIALLANNEEVCIVGRNRLIEKLMNFMHQRVEINGKIRGHPDGRKFLLARSCMPLKDIFNDE